MNLLGLKSSTTPMVSGPCRMGKAKAPRKALSRACSPSAMQNLRLCPSNRLGVEYPYRDASVRGRAAQLKEHGVHRALAGANGESAAIVAACSVARADGSAASLPGIDFPSGGLCFDVSDNLHVAGKEVKHRDVVAGGIVKLAAA